MSKASNLVKILEELARTPSNGEAVYVDHHKNAGQYGGSKDVYTVKGVEKDDLIVKLEGEDSIKRYIAKFGLKIKNRG